LPAGSPACSVSAGDARPQAVTWGGRRKKGNRRTTSEAARIAFQAVMEEGVGGVASGGGGEVAGTGIRGGEAVGEWGSGTRHMRKTRSG
jgi:hypothetical protein